MFGALDPVQYPQANFKSSIFHWVNLAAYKVPAGNLYGDTGRNSVRQPYYMRGDITLAKTFPITERQKFQFGMQIFNVFSSWHSSVLNGVEGQWEWRGLLEQHTVQYFRFTCRYRLPEWCPPSRESTGRAAPAMESAADSVPGQVLVLASCGTVISSRRRHEQFRHSGNLRRLG